MIGHSDSSLLDPNNMADDPVTEFAAWFEAAQEAGLTQPNAMILATARNDKPSVRTVLLKSFDEQLDYYTGVIGYVGLKV